MVYSWSKLSVLPSKTSKYNHIHPIYHKIIEKLTCCTVKMDNILLGKHIMGSFVILETHSAFDSVQYTSGETHYGGHLCDSRLPRTT